MANADHRPRLDVRILGTEEWTCVALPNSYCKSQPRKENLMAIAKLVVIYPRPKDVDGFESIYQNEHVPLAVTKLRGKTKIVATRVLGSPQGTPPFYRI